MCTDLLIVQILCEKCKNQLMLRECVHVPGTWPGCPLHWVPHWLPVGDTESGSSCVLPGLDLLQFTGCSGNRELPESWLLLWCESTRPHNFSFQGERWLFVAPFWGTDGGSMASWAPRWLGAGGDGDEGLGVRGVPRGRQRRDCLAVSLPSLHSSFP